MSSSIRIKLLATSKISARGTLMRSKNLSKKRNSLRLRSKTCGGNSETRMRSGRKSLLARSACRGSANRLKLNWTNAEKSKSDFWSSSSPSWLNVSDCRLILRPGRILARMTKIAGRVSKSDYPRPFNRKSLL
jgi:hypothetical protein